MFTEILKSNHFVPISTSILNSLPTNGEWRKYPGIKRLVIHCNDNGNWGPMDTAKYHISPDCHIKNMKGIAYHVFIDAKGDVYKTSNYDNVTWHVGIWNRSSLAVCIQYRGTGNTNPPNSFVQSSLHTTLAALSLAYGVTEIVGHRELQFTGWINNKDNLLKTCPGIAVNLDKVRRNTTMYIQKFLRDVGAVCPVVVPYTDKIDGIWGPMTQRSFDSFASYRPQFIEVIHRNSTVFE